MTAPTDAPVEERHRRAAVQFLDARGYYGNGKERWCATGCPADNGYAYPYEGQLATVLANAERDGRASRDAEHEAHLARLGGLLSGTLAKVDELTAKNAELHAYQAAWGKRWDWEHEYGSVDGIDRMDRILAEELARKGTP